MPTPNRFNNIPPQDYISEPEMHQEEDRQQPDRYRPASTLPHEEPYGHYGQPNKGRNGVKHSFPQNHFETFYDPYYSDSSQGPRSGTATPVIDKETR